MTREQRLVIEPFIQSALVNLGIEGQINVIFFTVVQISIFCIIVLTKIMDGWYYSNLDRSIFILGILSSSVPSRRIEVGW